jgi:hypothetical protein
MPTSETMDDYHQQPKNNPCHISERSTSNRSTISLAKSTTQIHHVPQQAKPASHPYLEQYPALVLKHTLTPLALPGANPNRLSAPNLGSLRVSLLLQNNTCLPTTTTTTTYYYYANFYIPHGPRHGFHSRRVTATKVYTTSEPERRWRCLFCSGSAIACILCSF